jgi:hypothetical protein
MSNAWTVSASGNAASAVASSPAPRSYVRSPPDAAFRRGLRPPKARKLGFEDMVDLSEEGLADGVRRITAGKGVDIVIEGIGGTVTSEALSSLGLGDILIKLGYSAGRKTAIDVTDLIWKRARMADFSLFAQSPIAITAAWRDILPLIVSGSVKPFVKRIHPPQLGGRSPAPPDRGSAVWQSHLGGVIDMTHVSPPLKLDVRVPAEGGIELGAWLFLPLGSRPVGVVTNG